MDEMIRANPGLALARMKQLDAITDVALSHVEFDAMLPELLDRVQETLAVDTVGVLLIDTDAGELVARAAKGIEEEVEQGVRIPIGQGVKGQIAATRQPIAIHDLKPGDGVHPILIEKGIRSLLGVPLIVQGEVLGVLHVGSLTRREFDAGESRLLELAAARIAPAIEHVRLYEAERDARRRAEQMLAEIQALQSISDAALAHLDLDDMLVELLDRLRAALGADTAAILLLDAETDELVARAARGIEETVERGVRIPVGTGFAGRIAAERRVVQIPDIAVAEIVNPILGERGIRSLVGAPLVAAGQVRGVIHVGSLEQRNFTVAEERLLQLAADRTATALEHSRLVREHAVALELQRRLLPERLPDIAGLTVAARYRPGQGAMVGGDWYDAVPLQGGAVGLAMGDVVSRGVRAVTAMGQLRQTLRTYAIEGEAPTDLVERLGVVVRSLDWREMVTLSYAALDAGGRELRYVSAGHPPPLVIEGGKPRFLEEARGAPLGAVAHPRYTQATAPLAPDSLIVLYTDGLVERRGRPLEEGLERLAATVVNAGHDPEEVCDAVMAALVDDDTTDDVALLVVRTVAQSTERFDLELPAISSSLGALRSALRRWLRDNGATQDDVLDVLIAVGEAAGNAVEHAYGPGDASFDVSGRVSGYDLDIVVRDYGSWRAPRGVNRGRGTLLMQELMDGFEVRTTELGTEVRLRRRLGMERAA